LRELRPLADFVADLVNRLPDGKAPYVGASAFGHKAGLHANALEKNPRTVEHIAPEVVGNRRRTLISEHAGASSILSKAAQLGLDVPKSSPEMREVLAVLKNLEHRGYAFEAADGSFYILAQKVLKKHKPFFDLEEFRVIVEKRGKNTPCLSEASIRVRVGRELEHTVAEGDGPVNALDNALRKALMRFFPVIAKVFLTDFRVRILDPEESTAAKTRVVIESSDGANTWGTVGVSENIIEASWQALLDSVEYKLFLEENRRAGKKRSGRVRRR
jgi:2-isopropylmalate synthase